jgi:uncharacterized membrane protein SpoIIM required for sporulation
MQTWGTTEAAFVAERKTAWDKLDGIVLEVQRRGVRKLGAADVAALPALYLEICADLSRAQAATYGEALVDYLQGLTAAAHAIMYGGHAKAGWGGGAVARRAVAAVLESFPQAVRRHRGAMLVSFLLFFVPLFGGLFATLADPSFATRVAPESMLRPLVHAYREGFDAGRGAGMDAAMAGFYVNNNVGIALRCFATGLAFGAGSAFYLVQNGLATGAIAGYVTAHGAGGNIFTFIVSHGSLELGAIVLAGGAGLAIGWSLVVPGGRTRLGSLQATARSVTPIVLGAATMLFMAAAVEGFWSASVVPAAAKRTAGAVVFVLLVAYFVFAGRPIRARRARASGGATGGRVPSAEPAPWT